MDGWNKEESEKNSRITANKMKGKNVESLNDLGSSSRREVAREKMMRQMSEKEQQSLK